MDVVLRDTISSCFCIIAKGARGINYLRKVNLESGIYVVPKYSKLTNELIPLSITEVANHIAEKYGWSIVPTGDACLNYLGLSTQMPAHYEYISDGPYRKYEVLGFTINFKHTTNKEVKNLSYKSAVIINVNLGTEEERKKQINSFEIALKLAELI